MNQGTGRPFSVLPDAQKREKPAAAQQAQPDQTAVERGAPYDSAPEGVGQGGNQRNIPVSEKVLAAPAAARKDDSGQQGKNAHIQPSGYLDRHGGSQSPHDRT